VVALCIETGPGFDISGYDRSKPNSVIISSLLDIYVPPLVLRVEADLPNRVVKSRVNDPDIILELAEIEARDSATYFVLRRG
jgi:hypothetical protein